MNRQTGSAQRLHFYDRIYTGVERLKGARIGSGTILPITVRLVRSSSIVFGQNVEIRRNSTIEGISKKAAAVAIGSRTRIKENVWIAAYGGFVSIGEDVLVGRNSVIHGHGGVTIESWSMLGPNVTLLTARHRHMLMSPRVPFQLQGEDSAPVVIGSGSWLGTGVTVLGGVTIGQDVVVGAGSLVTHDLLASGTYAGVPAERIGDLDQANEAPSS